MQPATGRLLLPIPERSRWKTSFAMAALALGAQELCALQHSSREPAPASAVQPALGAGVAIASRGELTAVLFEDDAAEAVYAAVSDGRALTFDAAVRIDTDAGAHDKFLGSTGSNAVLAVRGTAIYATWRDERNAGPGGAGGAEAVDVYFARSLDGGATWETDKPVPKGYMPGGLSPVMAHALAVSDSGQDVYVLQLVDPNYFGELLTEVWLSASHDGGATFAPAVRLAQLVSFYWYNAVALALDGDDVHVAFTGEPTDMPGPKAVDVFHVVAPKGVGFPPTPTLVDAPGAGVSLAVEGVSLAAHAGVVALAWQQDADWGGLDQEPYAAVSVDGGSTFTPPTPVDSDLPSPVYVDEVSVHVAEDGVVVVAWTDDRHGVLSHQTSVFVTRSTDGGTSFEPEVEMALPEARTPRLSGQGSDVTLTWNRWDAKQGSFSRDNGATWAAATIDISGEDVPFPPAYSAASAYNALYGNALAAWDGFDGGDAGQRRVFVGGYRPPEVLPAGFATGELAHVDLASFSGDAPFAWVVFAAAPGDLALPFGDGRNLGLAYDALLALSLASPAVLLTPLAPDGSGATASFTVPFAPGTALYTAAVSLAFSPAVALDEVTDVAAITVE